MRGFERRKSKKLRRKEWGICTLAFPNEQQEKVFEWFVNTATHASTERSGGDIGLGIWQATLPPQIRGSLSSLLLCLRSLCRSRSRSFSLQVLRSDS